MRATLRAILVCVLLLGFFSAAVEAQVTLTSPENGANFSSGPTFTWSGGDYDVYLFITVFYYDLGYWSGYYRVLFPTAGTSVPMPAAWWEKVGEDTACYWAVLGYNTVTHQWAVSSVFSFTKGDDCTDNDGDGYGSLASTACTYPYLDCDDTRAEVYPGAPELCDGVDNQCPTDTGYGEVDEGCCIPALQICETTAECPEGKNCLPTGQSFRVCITQGPGCQAEMCKDPSQVPPGTCPIDEALPCCAGLCTYIAIFEAYDGYYCVP